MKSPPRPWFLAVASVLAALMLATRFKHFGDALHLPDASMALFFLGGLWLRRHLAFFALLLLAVLIDEVSIRYLGISDFCVTPAYAFMPLAYALLWYAGRAYAPRLAGTPGALMGALGAGLLAASGAFLISNAAFYWLGGRYAEPHLSQYLARLWQWGPLFVRTTLGYIAVGLLLYGGLVRSRLPRAA